MYLTAVFFMSYTTKRVCCIRTTASSRIVLQQHAAMKQPHDTVTKAECQSLKLAWQGPTSASPDAQDTGLRVLNNSWQAFPAPSRTAVGTSISALGVELEAPHRHHQVEAHPDLLAIAPCQKIHRRSQHHQDLPRWTMEPVKWRTDQRSAPPTLQSTKSDRSRGANFIPSTCW